MSWLRRRIGRGSSRPDQTTIRVYLDREVDAARVVVSDGPVAHTQRIEGMGNADFDADGNLVALELFNVSAQVEAWRRREEERPGDEEPTKDLAADLQEFASRSVEQAKEIAKTG